MERELMGTVRSFNRLVTELRMEVANTDSMDFRDDLKRKEEVLKALVERLQ